MLKAAYLNYFAFFLIQVSFALRKTKDTIAILFQNIITLENVAKLIGICFLNPKDAYDALSLIFTFLPIHCLADQYHDVLK